MPNLEMPQNYDSEKSPFAGQEPDFELKSMAQTADGTKVLIVDYIKDQGLYVVSNVGDERSPLYKISPDKLRSLEN